MGRHRGFLPPAQCQQCGKPPDVGQTLWPGDQWRCITCLENHLPGKDVTTKSLNKMLQYSEEIQEAFGKEAKEVNAYHDRNRGEWARMMAAEIRKQGMARSQNIALANGEAVHPSTEKFLQDVLTIPDLAAVEASFDRSRLLIQSGTTSQRWPWMRRCPLKPRTA